MCGESNGMVLIQQTQIKAKTGLVRSICFEDRLIRDLSFYHETRTWARIHQQFFSRRGCCECRSNVISDWLHCMV